MDPASTSAPLITGEWPAEGLERTACPVCGREEAKILYGGLHDRTFFSAPGTWTLRRCGGCASAYLDPRPTAEALPLAYRRYFTHAEDPAAGAPGRGPRVALANAVLTSRWGYRARPAAPLGGVVARVLPGRTALVGRAIRHLGAVAGGRLLDVGSGSGAFVARMAALGWNAEGVEPDADAVAVAHRAGLRVTHGTLADMASAGPFEAVTLSHVIEHLHNPAEALEQVRALLRPGGVAWVATPNLRALGHRRYGRDWLHLDPPRHLVLFTPASLDELLRRCGLDPLPAPRPSPDAPAVFRASAAIRDGRRPDAGPAGRRRRLRALAFLAALREARDPCVAEEIVMLARRP
jgi:SAM-dependent methyltransferase